MSERVELSVRMDFVSGLCRPHVHNASLSQQGPKTKDKAVNLRIIFEYLSPTVGAVASPWLTAEGVRLSRAAARATCRSSSTMLNSTWRTASGLREWRQAASEMQSGRAMRVLGRLVREPLSELSGRLNVRCGLHHRRMSAVDIDRSACDVRRLIRRQKAG
jgi:hypothetical protein